MPRKLILKEKQAYEGAKMFYYIFLPFLIIAFFIISLIQNTLNFALATFTILFYIVSLKFYRMCNKIENSPENQQFVRNTSLSFDQEPNIKQKQIKTQIQMKTEDVLMQDKPQKHFCKFCQIKVSYRTRHCFKCSVCVLRYDHHCFWIGNCVGINNHRQFYSFLFFQTLENICMFIWASSLQIRLLLFITLQILCIGFIIFTGYLFLYHTMLIVSGMTTWEHLRRERISYLNYLPKGHNPFSKGIFTNIKQFFKKQWPIQWDIPTYQQAKVLEPSCNLLDNQYYNCC